jgi:hypothetical protein
VTLWGERGRVVAEGCPPPLSYPQRGREASRRDRGGGKKCLFRYEEVALSPGRGVNTLRLSEALRLPSPIHRKVTGGVGRGASPKAEALLVLRTAKGVGGARGALGMHRRSPDGDVGGVRKVLLPIGHLHRRLPRGAVQVPAKLCSTKRLN